MSFNEIAQQFAERPLSEGQVAAFCSEASITRPSFFDWFSRYIAHGYANEELTYTFCDAAMNNLIAFAAYEVPEYTWAVFSAFDQGEYYHSTDSRDVNPEFKYTKAQIAEIIANETVA